MCQNNGIIISIFLLKIIALFVIPGTLIYFKIRKFENYKKIALGEIILILFLITLSIFANDCAINSSFFRIKRISMNNKTDFEIIKESNDVSIIEEVQSSDKYTAKNNKKVYYFNNSSLPLSDKKISCDSKDIYFKNIGNNITAVSMLLSTEMNVNIDPLKLLNLSLENEIFDCDSGVSTSNLLNLAAKQYNVTYRNITRDEAVALVNSNQIVMAEITNNSSLEENITCEPSYIILYKINNEGKYNILNPNDKDYDYICPENSVGYGTVIKSNTNNKSWNVSDIDDIVTNYIVIER